MEEHCAEYNYLTIEEKILVDKQMKKWFNDIGSYCFPLSFFIGAERRIITIMKEENDK